MTNRGTQICRSERMGSQWYQLQIHTTSLKISKNVQVEVQGGGDGAVIERTDVPIKEF